MNLLRLIPKRCISNISTTGTILNRRELLYRSKQRGWLEVDLILGSWANDNIMKLSDTQLLNYKKILDAETSDIYTFLMGVKPIPDHLNNEIIYMIKKYSKEELKMRNASEYENIKKKMSN